MNLPKLKFWDQFGAAIHRNTNLKQMDKFNYSKSQLTDASLSGGPCIGCVQQRRLFLSVDNRMKIKSINCNCTITNISRFMKNTLLILPLCSAVLFHYLKSWIYYLIGY